VSAENIFLLFLPQFLPFRTRYIQCTFCRRFKKKQIIIPQILKVANAKSIKFKVEHFKYFALQPDNVSTCTSGLLYHMCKLTFSSLVSKCSELHLHNIRRIPYTFRYLIIIKRLHVFP
jgi:hypothetical protein